MFALNGLRQLNVKYYKTTISTLFTLLYLFVLKVNYWRLSNLLLSRCKVMVRKSVLYVVVISFFTCACRCTYKPPVGLICRAADV